MRSIPIASLLSRRCHTSSDPDARTSSKVESRARDAIGSIPEAGGRKRLAEIGERVRALADKPRGYARRGAAWNYLRERGGFTRWPVPPRQVRLRACGARARGGETGGMREWRSCSTCSFTGGEVDIRRSSSTFSPCPVTSVPDAGGGITHETRGPPRDDGRARRGGLCRHRFGRAGGRVFRRRVPH